MWIILILTLIFWLFGILIIDALSRKNLRCNSRSVQLLTLTKSSNKYRPSGKSIAILGAILNRSLASPGMNLRTSINNVEHVSRLQTWLKISLIKNLGYLELLVNNFTQISVNIQGAHCDKALRDDPNESFAVHYYWLLQKYRWRQAVCRTNFLPNQLLPQNINNLSSSLWRRLLIMC